MKSSNVVNLLIGLILGGVLTYSYLKWTAPKPVEETPGESTLSDAQIEEIDFTTQEELDEDYLKDFDKDRSVDPNTGYLTEIPNPDSTFDVATRWRGRIINSRFNLRKVSINNGYSFGINTLEEMLANIKQYNTLASDNGVAEVTGVRIQKYLKKRPNNKYFVDVFLIPVTYGGEHVYDYTGLNNASIQNQILTYNASNPCPNVCDD